MSGEDRFRRRVVAVLVVVAACVLGLAARLVYIQLVRAEHYRNKALGQHEATVHLLGQRGTITDRNGEELAVSVELDSAYVHPRQLLDAAGTVRRVAGALDLDVAPLVRRVNQGKPFVWIKRKISPAERRAIERLGLKDPVHFTRESARFYPKRQLASHVLGFVGMDGTGLEGIEKDYDGTIRGRGETCVVLRDGRQEPILQSVREAGRPGAGLELTLDEVIQHAAERELDAIMDEAQAIKSAIIVLDTRNGEVLALASRPTYNPNAVAHATAAERKNLAVGERYEPGSTFKIITAAAGLETGRVHPTDWFDCGSGSIVVNGVRIRDHHSYSGLPFTEVISRSSNVGIIRLGLRLGAETFHSHIKKFGFGKATGIGLSCEADGIVNKLARWSGISVASVSMGQEILVTPLQMVRFFAAIANGGTMVTPRLIRAVVLPDGRRIEPPAGPGQRVVSSATASTLTMMMEQVVIAGTGKSAKVPGYRVAGKTGTAQKIGEDGRYSHTQHVASFIGFAPAEDPRIAAIVVVDDPKGAYYGGEIAAPAFARVVGAALERLRVPPAEEEIPPATEFCDASQGRMAGSAARPATADGGIEDRGGEDAIEWPPRNLSHTLRGGAVAAASRPGDCQPVGSAASAATVPDLFGLGLREAVSLLSRRGQRALSIGSGFVVSQDPPAGSPAVRGGLCRLVLSTEPPEAPTPPEAGTALVARR